jgi:hypothetical protein
MAAAKPINETTVTLRGVRAGRESGGLEVDASKARTKRRRPIKKRRIFSPVARLAGLAILSGLMFSHLALTVPSVRAIEEEGPTFPPYTITYREIGTNTMGIAVSREDFLEAQRNNGDQAVIAFQSPDHSKDYYRAISLHSKGIRVSSNTYNSYTSTMGKGVPIIRRKPDPECRTDIPLGTERLGTENLLGFKVFHFKESGGTEYNTEEWIAPDLGCVSLRRVNQWKNPDGTPDGQSMSVREAVQALIADPLDDYFAVPAEGKDLSPSEYRKVMHPGRPVPRVFQMLDARYLADQAERAKLGIK